MTPNEVERAFNQDLFFQKGKGGNQLAFLNLVRAKSIKRPGFRPASAGRVKAGRATERVLMFVLVPRVTMPKIFDLDRVAEDWAGRYSAEFARRMGS